jgi:hypothetical protein
MRIAGRAAVALTALAVSGLTLSGCGLVWGAPPVTTYENADGETVTLNWRDYPSEAWVDVDEVLAAPDRDSLEPAARALVEELREAIESAADVDLVSAADTRESLWFDDENWFAASDNGYGGESMLVTVNCCSLASDSVPPPEHWRDVVEAASAVTRRHGLGPLVLDHESASMATDPAWAKEYAENYCDGALDDCWLWSATAYGNSQWVSFGITDGTRDATGQAAKDAEQFDHPLTTIAVDYGATVIDTGRRAEFERALEPFLGQPKPPATSD